MNLSLAVVVEERSIWQGIEVATVLVSSVTIDVVGIGSI